MVPLALLIVDLFVLAILAIVLCTRWRLPTVPAVVAAVFVWSYATIVLSAEILAAAYQLNSTAVLLTHAAVAVLAVAVWRRAGRDQTRQRAAARAVEHVQQRHTGLTRDLQLLGAAVAIAYALGLLVILLVPPNNWDSMTYHLSRIGYWLQYGSFSPWPTHNVRQTTFPMNAEIGVMWTMLLSGSDRFAGCVQWTSAIVGGFVIFGLAELLGYRQPHSLFAALIWASFPQTVLQSTSTQNDLLVSVFLLASVYLLLLGHSRTHRGALVASGVAFGLAVGTKSTLLFALPGLATGVLLLFVFGSGRRQQRNLVMWAAVSVGACVLLGVYAYGLNLAVYGSPWGPPGFVAKTSAPMPPELATVVTNAAQFLYLAADVTGIPDAAANSIATMKETVGPALFRALAIEPNSQSVDSFYPRFTFDVDNRVSEDLAWFGPLGLCLLLPSILLATVQAVRRRDLQRALLVIVAVSVSLGICTSLAWNPWAGRHFLLAATLVAPLLASYYRTGTLGRVMRWAIVAVCLVVLTKTVLLNEAKPLLGWQAIWSRDRIARQTLTRPALEPLLRLIERVVPPDARLGIIMGGDDWDYPLFGERLTRTLLSYAPRPAAVTTEWLAQQDVDFLLVREDLGRIDPTLGVSHQDDTWISEGWVLLRRRSGG